MRPQRQSLPHFIPESFDDPAIETIPLDRVIPSGERNIKMPSLNVLLTCVDETELKLVLASKRSWTETAVIRNFVAVSPLMVGAITRDHSSNGSSEDYQGPRPFQNQQKWKTIDTAHQPNQISSCNGGQSKRKGSLWKVENNFDKI